MGSGICVGPLISAEPRLVQCSVRDVGSGTFAGGFSKCLTQPSSLQGMRCQPGVFVRVLNMCRNKPISVQGPRFGLRSICSGI